MEYRIDKQGLLDAMSAWNGFLKRKVHLVACGGTAMTLLDIKASTKDVDLLVPETDEYDYLLNILKDLGYRSASGAGWARGDGFIFDLFRGKSVHTTELLESPLDKGNNIPIKELSHIYLGVLNYYDLLISKIFRGTSVDMDDCIMLMKAKKSQIDIGRLSRRFKETASYDVSYDKASGNMEHFMRLLKKEGFQS